MSEGRRSGLASALGLLTGTLIHVARGRRRPVGADRVLARPRSTRCATSAPPISSISGSGAASAPDDGARAARRRPSRSARAYRQAIVVQLLNPKVALFFLAFLPQFVDPARGPVATQVLVLGAILGALGFLMDCLYAIVSAAAAGRLRSAAAAGKVTGAVYLALGAAAALTGGRR